MNAALQFDTKKFISAKDAAKRFGYTNDYIGQLCRGGKIEARMVGHSWFVAEDSIAAHTRAIKRGGIRLPKDQSLVAKATASLSPKPAVFEVRMVSESPRKDTFSYLSYAADDRPLIPVPDKRAYRSVEPVKKENSVFPKEVVSPYARNVRLRVDRDLWDRAVAFSVAALFVSGLYFMGYTENGLALYARAEKRAADVGEALADLGSVLRDSPSYARVGLGVLEREAEAVIGQTAEKIASAYEGAEQAVALVYEEPAMLLSAAPRVKDVLAHPVRSTAAIFATSFSDVLARVKENVGSYFGGFFAEAPEKDLIASKQNVPSDEGGNESAVLAVAQGGADEAVSEEKPVKFPSSSDLIAAAPKQVTQNITYTTTVQGISSDYLESKLSTLSNAIMSEIYRLSSKADSNTTYINNVYNTVAHTNKIDQLRTVNLYSPTIAGGTIKDATFQNLSGSFNAEITGTSATFSNGLTVNGQLTVTGTATSSLAGDVAFDTNTLYVDSLNNRVGIGTTSPTDTLSVAGPIFLQNVTPATTNNRIYANNNNLYFAGNLIGGATTANWTTDGTHAWRPTGNVGVGTTSPSAKLAVEGSAYISGTTFIGGAITATSTLNVTGLTTLGHASTTQLSSTNDAYFATTGGNVGIGTTSPGARLGVAGDILADNITGTRFIATSTTATSTFAGFIDVNGTGTNATSTFASNLWVKGTLQTGTGSIYLTDTSITAGSGAFKLNTSATSTFATNGFTIGTNQFVVQQTSGNVGIGTTSPWGRFAVGAQDDEGVSAYFTGQVGIGVYNGNGDLTVADTNPDIVLTDTTQAALSTGRDWRLKVSSGDFLIDDIWRDTVFAITKTNGNVGIGETAPGSKLSVSGGATIGASYDTTAAPSNGLLVQGSVGISTTSPSQLLSVHGNLYTSGTSFFGGAITATSTLNVTGLTTLGNASTTQISSTGSAYFATTGGNVGIGTAAPRGLVDVRGKALIGNLNSAETISGGQMELRAAGNTDTRLDISQSGVGFASIGFKANDNKLYITNNFSGSDFGVASKSITINTSGLVGIGTTSPSQLLSVHGNLYTSGTSFFGGAITATSTLTLSATSTHTYISNGLGFAGAPSYTFTGDLNTGVWSSGADTINVSTAGSERMRISSAGNASFGTTAAYGHITAVSDQATMAFLSTTNSSGGWLALDTPVNGDSRLIFTEGGTSAFRWTIGNDGNDGDRLKIMASDATLGSGAVLTIEQGGNVGIGTTSPTFKLDVYGTNGLHVTNASGGSSALVSTQQGTGYIFEGKHNGSNVFRVAYRGQVIVDTEFANGETSLTVNHGGGSNSYAASFNGGNVGIGTTSPAALFSVAGNGYFTGNIGVGVASPGKKLHIQFTDNTAHADNDTFDGIRIINLSSTASTGATLSFLNGVSGDAVSGIKSRAVGADKNALDFFTEGSAGRTTKLTILDDGNVGIGTTSPSAKFSFTGDGTGATRAFVIADSSNAEKISILNNGNVGIGISAPASKLDVNGDEIDLGDGGSFTFDLDVPNSATTRANFNTDAGTAMSILGTGNVGVGTTTPGQKLDVNGDMAWGYYNNTAGAQYAMRNGTAVGGLYTGNSVFGLFGGSTAASHMVINSSGNVGIGTTGPFGKLQINAPVGATTAFLSNSANIFAAYDVSRPTLALWSNDAAAANKSANLSFGGETGQASTPYYFGKIKGAKETGGTYNGYLSFETTETDSTIGEKMRITSTGNVGIGTTSPAATLAVQTAGASVDAMFADSSNEVIHRYISGSSFGEIQNSGGGMFLRTTSAHSIGFDTNSARAMTILSGGNVGIGTTSPAALFAVGGNAVASGGIYGTATGLGIGKASPSFALDIFSSATSARGVNSLVTSTSGTNYGGVFQSNGSGASTNIGGYFHGSGATNNYGIQIESVAASASNYAIYSNSAAQSYFQGNVGIGTASPGNKLSVKSAGSGSGLNLLHTNDTVVGEFEAEADGDSYIYLNNGSGTNKVLLYSNGDSYFNGGNVGVGTAVPDTRMHVTGDFDGSSLTGTTDLNKGITIQKKTGVTSDYGDGDLYGLVLTASSDHNNDYPIGAVYGEVTGTASYVGGSLHLLTKTQSEANLNKRLTINSGGNVGIGTTTPGGLLDLYKDAGSNGITEFRISQGQGNDGYTRLRAYEDANGFALSGNWVQGTAGYATGDYVGTRDYATRAAGQFGLFLNTTAAASHFDFAGALGDTIASVMRIQLDGNVGIGTTSPIELLSLHSSGTTRLAVGSLGGALGKFKADSNAVYVAASSNHPLVFQVNDSAVARFDTSGNLGIGTTSPQNILHVNGSSDGLGYIRVTDSVTGSMSTDGVRIGYNSGALRIQNYENSNISFLTNNTTEAVTIKNDGNVGIGTTTPGAKLEVAGASAQLRIHDTDVSNVFWSLGTDNNADLAVWENTVTNANNRLMIKSGGNVGIGNTSPSANLHVGSGALTGLTGGTFPAFAVAASDDYSAGDGGMVALINTTAPAVGNSYNQNKGGSLIFGGRYTSASTATASWAKLYGAKENSTDANYAGYLAFLTRAHAGNLTEYMRITSTGNVGIGTTDPGNYRLKVVSAGLQALQLTAANSTVGGPLFDFVDSGRSTESIMTSTDGTTVGTYIASYSNHPLMFGVNAGSSPTARMVINTSGNVGIGTASPKGVFDIKNRYVKDSKTIDISSAWTTVLSIDLGGDHRSARAKIFYGGTDWGCHSASRFEAEFDIIDGAGGYNEPGRVLYESDHTNSDGIRARLAHISPHTVNIQLQTYDKEGNGFSCSDDTPGASSILSYEVEGNFSSVGETSGTITATSDIPNLAFNNGNVAIGTSTPTSKLEVSGGDVKITDGQSFGWRYSAGDSSMYNYIKSTYDTGANVGIEYRGGAHTASQGIVVHNFQTYNAGWQSRMAIKQDGNVGIGNTSPEGKFHVGAGLTSASDAAAITLKQTSTTATTGLYLERSGEQRGYYMYIGGSLDSLNFQRNNVGTKADVMTLTREGNVGIGTTSPTTPFSVYNTSNQVTAEFVGSSNSTVQNNGGSAFVRITNSNATNGNMSTLAFADSGNTANAAIMAYHQSHSAHTGDLAFGVRNAGTYAEAMRIISTGNVGIGTASPTSLGSLGLHIKGSASGGIRLEGGEAYEIISGGSTSGLQFWDVTSSAERIRIDTSGNVGIGTTDPSSAKTVIYTTKNTAALTLAQSDADTTSYVELRLSGDAQVANRYSAIRGVNNVGADVNELAFLTSNVGAPTEKVRINKLGNVGIGTTSPYKKLSVTSTTNGDGLVLEGSGDIAPGLRLMAGATNANARNWGMTTNNQLSGDFILKQSNAQFGDPLDAGTIRLIINPSGNVGIGTAAPGKKLSVNGTTEILQSDTGTGGHLILRAQAGGYLYQYNVQNYTDKFRIWRDGDGGTGGFVDLITGNATGNVGIGPGATSPSALFVVSTTTDAAFSNGVMWLQDSDGLCKHDPESTAVTVSCSSDARLKTDIRTASSTLSYLLELPLKDFTVIASGDQKTGVIAQELLALPTYSDLVSMGDDGYYTVAEISSWKLIKGLQEFGERISLVNAPTTTPSMYIDSSGNIGIGTTSPEYKLHVIGDVAATSFVNISTKTAKKDIEYYDEAQKASVLEKMKNVGIATYNYIGECADDPATRSNLVQGSTLDCPKRLGLIAEEAPSEVLSANGKGVDVYKLSTFILAGVQEQQKQIEAIDIRLKKVEDLIASGGTNASFLDILASFGVKIANGVAEFKNVIVASLTVGSDQSPAGVTLYDKTTKQPYCFFMENGAPKTTQGSCGTTSDQPQTTGSGEPIFTLNGNNPAAIDIGSSYTDLGVRVVDPTTSNELSYRTFLNGTEVATLTLDTATSTTYTIEYVATTQAGVTATTTRSVIVGDASTTTGGAEPSQSTSPASEPTASSTPQTTETETAGGGTASSTPSAATASEPATTGTGEASANETANTSGEQVSAETTRSNLVQGSTL